MCIRDRGYFSHVENRTAIQEGMSEIQTIKTAIHESAHAKRHAGTPGEKVAPEDKKDRRTKEVEAESVILKPGIILAAIQ